MRVRILAYDGVDDLDLFGVFEVLRKGFDVSESQCDVAILGVTPVVVSAGGVSFSLNHGIDSVDRADLVVIPGGPGIGAVANLRSVTEALRRHCSLLKPVATVCTGALLLAKLGLLSGMTVAVHQEKREQLALLGECDAVSGLVVDGWLTSVGGPNLNYGVKSIELAFALLSRYCPAGVQFAQTRLEVSPERTRHCE